TPRAATLSLTASPWHSACFSPDPWRRVPPQRMHSREGDTMSQLITGSFPNRDIAERAVTHLIDAGFAPEDTSILMSEGTRGREFQMEKSTKAPEGAVTGATVGGVLG